ncbi:alpha-L-fucosidase [Filimonas lacunae]|uniref:alpha-L-fucosidase n=1 Tax=Filimonas lacunae TaxID=477680 RepID=A0A173MCV5_9BACT|nr:alpha-L-fucosidase [Filimonas lacunae]BAV05288.1 alpha-L-fucosidase [Filimonas lacunae]SIT22185.1 alpha-L-fucosidase [Filimonas lacunae]
MKKADNAFRKRKGPIVMKRILFVVLNLTGLYGTAQKLELPPPSPLPSFNVVAPERSVAMGNPDSFPEVKMDFPIATGPFEPTWQSINDHYPQYPDWLREAKFGIWVHFGPQASGLSGDWYARRMYVEGEASYANHVRDDGHPATPEHGYKDLLKTWNPVHYNPAKLVKTYHDAGARFLFIQGVHHDNYDLWNSAYQPWNSVNIGPKRDLLNEWATAVRAADMHYGITFHHEYTWWWWESAYRSDSAGKYAGIPYDGALTARRDTSAWWAPYDLRMLYGPNMREYKGIGESRYAPLKGIFTQHLTYAHWYANNWALRMLDAINKYDPDFIYTDGNSTQPFSGFKSGTGYKCDAAQRVVASYYNQALRLRGKTDVFSVVKFHPAGRKGVVTTFEGKFPKTIKTDQPWIGENALGDWYYGPGFVYSADAVIRFLLECVSRDGCYAVSIPIRPDGSLAPECERMLTDIGKWMTINGDGIYGSKAWKKIGEGKDSLRVLPSGNLGKKQAEFVFAPTDIRFTEGKDGNVYVYCMTVPKAGTKLAITSLGWDAHLLPENIQAVELLGYPHPVQWKQAGDALHITFPAATHAKTAVCFRIKTKTI